MPMLGQQCIRGTFPLHNVTAHFARRNQERVFDSLMAQKERDGERERVGGSEEIKFKQRAIKF